MRCSSLPSLRWPFRRAAGAGGAACGPPSAQEPAATAPSPAPGVAEPTKDLIDVVRELRHKPPPPPPDYKKRMVAGSPVVGYSPTSGVSAGVAGNVAFYKGFPRGHAHLVDRRERDRHDQERSSSSASR